MSTLARWCFRHRVLVLVGWTLVLAVLAGSHAVTGSRYPATFDLPGSDSAAAQALLAGAGAGQDSGTVVVHTALGRWTEVGDSFRLGEVAAAIGAQPHVMQVLGPGGPDGVRRISPDGRTAFVEVVFDTATQDLPASAVAAVRTDAERLRSAGVEVEFGGDAFSPPDPSPGSTGEVIGLAAAAVVVYLVFGSLLTTSIPLLCGVFALTAGLQTVGLLSHVVDIAAVGPRAATLVGLGVGVDYTLFVLTRHREALADGSSPEEAAVAAVATSGRAVVLAGGSVILAMVALLVPGVPFLRGIGIAAAVVVLFAVAVSVTVSPALFGLVGERARAGRTSQESGRRSWWHRWTSQVQRRPVLLGAAALGLMTVLAVPLLTMRLGAADEGTAATGSTARRAYDLMTDSFGPGANGRLQVVARVDSDGDRAAFADLTARIAQLPDVDGMGGVVDIGRSTASVDVQPRSAPQAPATGSLIDAVRATARSSALDVHVGGATATLHDFTTTLSRSLPRVLAYLVLSSALVMLAAFRSVVLAVTAAVTNLLAAASSLGVVVVVFQWGWARSWFAPGDRGPVDAFLPVLLAAILIGLSTDYHVFLVSRTREEWARTGDHALAVRTGQVATSRVITAAAAIMVSVFLAFAFDGERTIAEFGVGLAVAVLLDAWVLRTVLVPAIMVVAGPATWWRPVRWRTGRRPGAPVPVAAIDLERAAPPQSLLHVGDAGLQGAGAERVRVGWSRPRPGAMPVLPRGRRPRRVTHLGPAPRK